MDVRTLDYHTGGEPLRIVTGGLPSIEGDTMLERRRYFSEHLDHYRRLLVLEPRGHADMYGAVPTAPASDDGDLGVLFLHNEGYSTMCGHGIIALVTAGLEHGLFAPRETDCVRIDTPAGRIVARPTPGPDGKITSVAFENVPSFVLRDNVNVFFEDREVSCTVAFGGAYYAYFDAARFGLDLVPSESAELVRLGRELKQAVAAACPIEHPEPGKADLGFLYGVIFVKPGDDAGRSRNVCVFADGEIDRSPTGTGVSGRAAIHFARGDIELGQRMEIESLVNTKFSVRCLAETRVGGLPAIVPEVTGSAHICGESRLLMDPGDPLAQGFMIR